MWAAIAAAYEVAYASYGRKTSSGKSNALNRLAAMYDVQRGGPYVPYIGYRAAPTKCACCGSREFRVRGATRICAYCRSEV